MYRQMFLTKCISGRLMPDYSLDYGLEACRFVVARGQVRRKWGAPLEAVAFLKTRERKCDDFFSCQVFYYRPLNDF